MAEVKSPKEVLQSYTQRIHDALVKSLHDVDRIARGGLAQSIRVETKVYGQRVALEVSMLEYWEFVEEGRRKGAKQPPQQAMLDFIRDRGLKVELSNKSTKKIKSLKNKTVKKGLKQVSRDKKLKSLAFLIGRSISRKGIAPTHFASKVLNKSLVDEIKADLRESVGRSIQVEIKDIIT